MPRREDPGEHEARGEHQNDRGTRGHVQRPRQVQAHQAARRPQGRRQDHHGPQPVTQEPRGRRGGDEQCQHQHVADRLHGNHDGQGHGDIQGKVREQHVHARRPRALAVQTETRRAAILNL